MSRAWLAVGRPRRYLRSADPTTPISRAALRPVARRAGRRDDADRRARASCRCETTSELDPKPDRRRLVELHDLSPPPTTRSPPGSPSGRSTARTVRSRSGSTCPTARFAGVHPRLHGGRLLRRPPGHERSRQPPSRRRDRVGHVSSTYGLGPEEPYPAGPDDVRPWRCGSSRTRTREWGVPLESSADVVGGANLAATTLVRLRDRHDAAG